MEVANINGNIEIIYEEGQIHSYVTEILTMGLCSFFFRGSFVKSGGTCRGFFQTDGYRRLSSFKEFSTEDIFSIVIAVLQGVISSERHYIFSEEYEISFSTVFADKGLSSVKLVFAPAEERIPLPEKLVSLLKGLKVKGCSEGLSYIDSAVEFIEQNGFNDKAVLHHLENLRREVYLCSIA